MTEQKCTYDYESKCDCSEDDKCGCSFPNNMAHDFSCNFEEDKFMLAQKPFDPQKLPDEIRLAGKFDLMAPNQPAEDHKDLSA